MENSQTDKARPYAEFSERLTKLMEGKDLNGSSLALALSSYSEKPITPQAVSRWVSGHGLPSERRLNELAQLLGVEPKDLLGEFSIPKPGRKRIPAHILDGGLPPLVDAAVHRKKQAKAKQIVDSKSDEERYVSYSLQGFQDPEYAYQLEFERLESTENPPNERRSRIQIEKMLYLTLAYFCDTNDLPYTVDRNRAVIGPLFKDTMDLVVAEDIHNGLFTFNKIRFGVLVVSGRARVMMPRITGTALNWKLGTKGYPLHLVFVDTTYRGPVDEPLTAAKEKEHAAAVGEVLFPLTKPQPGLDGPLVDKFTVIVDVKAGRGGAEANDNMKELLKLFANQMLD